MEPRAAPATTRGRKPCPHPGSVTTKTYSKTDTEHKASNAPERLKHLKSLVLAIWAGPYAVNVPLHAFDDWCWDLGVQPGQDIGMSLVSATNAWFPWVGTINLT